MSTPRLLPITPPFAPMRRYIKQDRPRISCVVWPTPNPQRNYIMGTRFSRLRSPPSCTHQDHYRSRVETNTPNTRIEL
jgi:hypothetical protein